MYTIQRTTSTHPDFIKLIRALDQYLAALVGNEFEFYSIYNSVENIQHVLVAYENGEAVGCGAIKAFAPNTMEVKRMYVKPSYRRTGVATQILQTLENWAKELGNEKCVLETGREFLDANTFYKKNGYQVIPNYGQYIGVKTSICFEKVLERH
jgi:GNAT superfamily N-acetyltransferase